MSYSFLIPRDEFRRVRWYGNGNHRASVTRSQKWKKCERRMSAKLKENVYKAVSIPTMLCGAEILLQRSAKKKWLR